MRLTDSDLQFRRKIPCGGFRIPAEVSGEQPITTMGDKNPKALKKLHAQQEVQRKQKAEGQQRHQQRLHEMHEMKHPHEVQEPKT